MSGKRERLELSKLFNKSTMLQSQYQHQSGAIGSPSSQFSRQGKTSGISQEQKEKLREILESKKPSDFGFNESKWSAMNVRNLIQEQFQVDYQESSVKKLIHKMNMTFGAINDSSKATPAR
ncbi:hypothetical protein [Endozoicomonas atrinae]|uniref:hypothetical protein n=1 Tax=Endozoicomonas atrinae TaxID=1333660 RepID=UPI003AFFEAF6